MVGETRFARWGGIQGRQTMGEALWPDSRRDTVCNVTRKEARNKEHRVARRWEGHRLQGGQEHMVARQWERQGGQMIGETRSTRWPGTEGGQTVGGTRSSKWPGRSVGQAVK